MSHVETATRYQVGQEVRHVETMEVGVVVAIMAGRYFVTWERDGKTFIYPGIALVEV